MAILPRPTLRGNTPGGLLGCFLLVIAAELFVTRHDRDATPTGEWQYLLASRAATLEAKSYDLLAFGDSQVKMGVLPDLIGERSGLRAYNLAVTGASAPASFELLRRAIAGGAAPSAVLVDFHQFMLAMPPQANHQTLPFVLSYDTACRLGVAVRDPAFLAGLVARKALPSLRCRQAIRLWVESALEGKPSPFRSTTAEAVSHWGKNQGAWVMKPESDPSGTCLAAQRLT
ncbi:MAG: hypothetical protein U0835_03995 [Isosphaeraceae bacterium]